MLILLQLKSGSKNKAYFIVLKQMNYSDIDQILNKIEQSYPVNKWKIGQHHVWPIIKLEISGAFNYYVFFSEKNSLTNEITEKKKVISQNKLWNKIKWYLPIYPYSDKLFLKDGTLLKNQIADVLFFSSSVYRINVENYNWYNWHCDPLIDYFKKDFGKSVLFVENRLGDTLERKPRYNDDTCIDFIYSDDIYSHRNYFFKSNVLMDGYVECLEELSKNYTDVNFKALDIENIVFRILRINYLVAFFVRLLKRMHTKLCFTVCYYYDAPMALNIACKQLNIPVIEIQHGVQDFPPYTSWNKIPEGGYSMLPKMFWNWSQEDADRINLWADSTNGAHKAINGGYAWREFWKTKNPIISPYQENLEKHFDRNFKHVVLTMGLYLPPDWLFDAINSSPDNWRFYFRLHPRMFGKFEEFKKEIYIKSSRVIFERDTAIDIPMMGVLSKADVHITELSSTIIEAEYFGVPTVLIDILALSCYEKQVKNGFAVYAENEETLINAIKKQIDFKDNVHIDNTAKCAKNTTQHLVDEYLRQ